MSGIKNKTLYKSYLRVGIVFTVLGIIGLFLTKNFKATSFVFSLFFLVSGFISVYLALFIFKPRKKVNSRRNRMKIIIQPENIVINRVDYNFIDFFQLELKYKDIKTLKELTFISEIIEFNPEELILNKSILVYLNPKNNKDYYVDISFLPKPGFKYI